MTLQLTSVMGYFMTHLLMLGKIRDIPLYELDAMELRKKSTAAFPFTLFTVALYNFSLITDASRTRCSRVRNRLQPLVSAPPPDGGPRHVHAHAPPRTRAPTPTLDTVRERFDVRCGPLT